MITEQIITIISLIIGGGGIGAILTAVFTAWVNRNKPQIDSADVTSKLYQTTISQLDQMQKDVERLRKERDDALREAQTLEIKYNSEFDKREAAQTFNKMIEARAAESSRDAREWHERAIQAEGELKGCQAENSALRQRVIEEKAGVAALGVELMRHQTGPLNAVKVVNDKSTG